MCQCPFCPADVPDLAQHYITCPAVVIAFGPVRVRLTTDGRPGVVVDESVLNTDPTPDEVARRTRRKVAGGGCETANCKGRHIPGGTLCKACDRARREKAQRRTKWPSDGRKK